MNDAEQQLAAVIPEIFADEAGKTLTTDVVSTEIIPAGQRNARMTTIAGKLRRIGFPADTIAGALHIENRRRCQPPLGDAEIEAVAASVARYPSGAAITTAPLMGLTIAELATRTFPPRRPLLMRGETAVFREGHLGQVTALRGLGKTWLLQTLALVAAAGADALGFSAPEPCRVLHIDGEMASEELQERYAALRDRLHISRDIPLTIVANDWQEEFLRRLDTDAGQDAVEPFIANADLVIIDNRSCLFDPLGEKDPDAWQPAQDWLLSLRRRGKGVMFAHHANRQGSARGHSKAEDPLNLMITLARPEDYRQDEGARFTVTFDKARGVYGAAVAPFEAHLTATGWQTSSTDGQQNQGAQAKLLAYLKAAHDAGERPTSASKAISAAQIKKTDGLRAWAELVKSGAIRQHGDGGWF